MVPSHLFICFSSKDQAAALGVVEFLEAHGLPCWISARDVPPGQNYQETIVQALEQAKGVVFLLSESSAASGEIKKELSLAGSFNAPVFPVRLTAITPSGALRYELATRQWIDIFPDRDRALQKLADTIHKLIAAPAASFVAPTEAAPARAPAAHGRLPHTPIVASGSAEFEAIRALLARHIGPIAKVLVQKAAIEAASQDEFCERLAASVSAPAERAAFLKAARVRLAAKS